MPDERPTEIDDTTPLDIAEVLEDLNDRTALAELQAELVQVCMAVLKTGKRGKVTLVLDVEKSKDFDLVHVTATIKGAPPKGDAMPRSYWIGDHGEITRKPAQKEIQFTAVEATA